MECGRDRVFDGSVQLLQHVVGGALLPAALFARTNQLDAIAFIIIPSNSSTAKQCTPASVNERQHKIFTPLTFAEKMAVW
jgi:hypothetical protein